MELFIVDWYFFGGGGKKKLKVKVDRKKKKGVIFVEVSVFVFVEENMDVIIDDGFIFLVLVMEFYEYYDVFIRNFYC